MYVSILFTYVVSVCVCNLMVVSLIERKVLKGLVSSLVWYQPLSKELRLFGDGGVAIIDQWIAARAKYFIGKY